MTQILARSVTLAAALLVAGSYVATAQTQAPAGQPAAPQRAGAAQACKPDIQKFCASVQPGGGRIAACLKDHAADLSADCKKAAAQQRPATPAK
jgi:hypothetical protein